MVEVQLMNMGKNVLNGATNNKWLSGIHRSKPQEKKMVMDESGWNQIETKIVVQQRFRKVIRYSKSVPGTDGNSDHIPVGCMMRCKMKKLWKPNVCKCYDMDILIRDEKQ